MKNKKLPKIGLALGGGGAKGYAHIGAIKLLEENNIPVDFIAGSSIGALVGALYSFFKKSEKLESLALSNNWHQFFSLIDPSFKGGLIKGERIEEFISKTIKNSTFEQLKIPLTVIATDFKTARMVELAKGNVASAVRASICFPLLFKPVLRQKKLLWDGGLSSPVPVKTVRKMGADIVIAVNLYNKIAFSEEKSPIKKTYSIILNSIESVQYHLAKECLNSADIVIEPITENLGLLGLDKFLKGKGKKIVAEGKNSAKLALPQIKKLIEEKTL